MVRPDTPELAPGSGFIGKTVAKVLPARMIALNKLALSLVLLFLTLTAMPLRADSFRQLPDGVYEHYGHQQRFWVDATVAEVAASRKPYPLTSAWLAQAWEAPYSIMPDWSTLLRYSPHLAFAGVIAAAYCHLPYLAVAGLIAKDSLGFLWQIYTTALLLPTAMNVLWKTGSYGSRFFLPGSSRYYPLAIDWDERNPGPLMVMIIQDRQKADDRVSYETLYRISAIQNQVPDGSTGVAQYRDDDYLSAFAKTLREQGVHVDIVLNESQQPSTKKISTLVYRQAPPLRKFRVRAWNDRGIVQEGVFEVGGKLSFIEDVLLGRIHFDDSRQHFSVLMEPFLEHIDHWLRRDEYWEGDLSQSDSPVISGQLPGPDWISGNDELHDVPSLMVQDVTDEDGCKVLNLGQLEFRLPHSLQLSPETSDCLAIFSSNHPEQLARPVEVISRDSTAGYLYLDWWVRRAIASAIDMGLHYQLSQFLGGYKIVFTPQESTASESLALTSSETVPNSVLVTAEQIPNSTAYSVHVEYVGNEGLPAFSPRDVSEPPPEQLSPETPAMVQTEDRGLLPAFASPDTPLLQDSLLSIQEPLPDVRDTRSSTPVTSDRVEVSHSERSYSPSSIEKPQRVDQSTQTNDVLIQEIVIPPPPPLGYSAYAEKMEQENKRRLELRDSFAAQNTNDVELQKTMNSVNDELREKLKGKRIE